MTYLLTMHLFWLLLIILFSPRYFTLIPQSPYWYDLQLKGIVPDYFEFC